MKNLKLTGGFKTGLSILVMMFILAIGTSTVRADETTKDGQFTYVANYYKGTATITGYNGTNPVANVPAKIDGNKVIGIGYAAFYENEVVTEVNLPDSVKSIGEYAFFNCPLLKKVTMKGVEDIGKEAFASTPIETASVGRPKKGIGIGNGAFEDCANLKNFDFTAVTRVGYIGFVNCASLKKLENTQRLRSYGANAFAGSGVELVKIQNKKEEISIGDSCFSCCYSLKSLELSYGLFSSHGSKFTFNDCTNLTDITIAESVTYIPYHGFKNTKLTTVIVPGEKVFLDSGCFAGISTLTDVYILSESSRTDHWDYTSAVVSKNSRAVIHGIKGSDAQKTAKASGVRFAGFKSVTGLKLKKSKKYISINWKKLSGIKSYSIYRSNKKDGTYKKVANVKKNKYVDKKVKKKKTYYYKIAYSIKINGKSYNIYFKPKKIYMAK